MSARRAVVMVAVSASAAALLSAGPAVAGAHPGASPATHASAAADGLVARALATSGSAAARHSYDLVDPHGRADESFGEAVAVSGSLLLVGAPGDDSASSADVGAVYVYRRPASGWSHATKVATLLPSDGSGGDQFGDGVAISGSTIVVAAGYRTVGTNVSQGALYVFSEPAAGWRGTRRESAELTASDGQSGDYLGYEGVAVSGGVVTAAGSLHDVGTNSEQGAVYVWVEPKAGWSGQRHENAELTASDGASGDYLGYGAVAFAGTSVVAASGYHAVGTSADQGAVYVWNKPKAGWSGARHQSAELVASDGASDDYLGYEALSASGSTIVAGSGYHKVGANAAQGELDVWQRPTGGWSATLSDSARLVASDGAAGDYLGYGSAAISGRTIFATAPYRTVGANIEQGTGYTFTEPTHGWSGTQTDVAEISDPHGVAGDELGIYNSTAISGTTDVAGESGRGIGTNSDQGAVSVFSPARPKLNGLAQSHQSLRVTSRRAVLNPAHRPAGGIKFSFSLTEAGTVTLRFAKHKHGHSTRAGALTFSAPAGHSAVFFFGKIKSHKLAAGSFSMSASVSNDAGISTSHSARFTVTKH